MSVVMTGSDAGQYGTGPVEGRKGPDVTRHNKPVSRQVIRAAKTAPQVAILGLTVPG